ncbi:MAG: cytochrome ubiquinol oxidase subunit I [Candidatus Dormibacteraeota bacterium]|nr:cytochrome ubiquinol oxidase subunit I [Candidatus Dormibacteraeota bacterium]
MTLNPVGGNLVTNGLLVAIVILAHIQISAYLIGASTLAIISESVSLVRQRRGAGGLGDARHDRLAHGLVKTSVYVFSFGSALAIFFMVFVLSSVWGKFFVTFQSVTFWSFFLEALAFFVEVALIYTVYANWQRLANHRRARLGLLILLNLDMWWQMWFIDVVASFMLTPNGGDVNYLNQILNPTQIPLDIHRTVGNIAFTGAVVAGVAAFKYLRATRRLEAAQRTIALGATPAPSVGAMSSAALAAEPHEAAEARYWDWVAQWGVLFLLGFTLLQPWIGYSYAKEVQLHAYASWFDMMFGSISNVFLVQITLLGTIFTLSAAYFWRRMKAAEAPHHRRQGVLVLLLALTTLWAAQPAWFAWTYDQVVAEHLNYPWWQGGLLNPIGNFIPYKVGALFAMVFFGLWAITSYLRAYAREELPSGRTGRRAQWLLVGLTVVTSVMMIVMGIIREHSRQPYLVNGEITISNQQITNNQPSLPGGSSTSTSPAP